MVVHFVAIPTFSFIPCEPRADRGAEVLALRRTEVHLHLRLLGVTQRPVVDNGIAEDVVLGVRRPAPHITRLSPKLAHLQRNLEKNVREFSHQVKMMFKGHEDGLISNQMIQRRLSEVVLWIHAATCSLSRIDQSIRSGASGADLDDEMRTVEYVCALAGEEITLEVTLQGR